VRSLVEGSSDIDFLTIVCFGVVKLIWRSLDFMDIHRSRL
jgi:hypothetical protein